MSGQNECWYTREIAKCAFEMSSCFVLLFTSVFIRLANMKLLGLVFDQWTTIADLAMLVWVPVLIALQINLLVWSAFGIELLIRKVVFK